MSERNLHTVQVPLSALESFLAAAEAESWSGASAAFSRRGVKLNRFAIQRQVEALEDYLGVRLFKRTKRSIHLNPAGIYYVPEATSLVNKAASARHTVQLVSPPLWDKLPLGYAPSPTVEFRELAIDHFETDYKTVSVISNDLSADACKKEVAAGRLLVALLPDPLHLPEDLAFEPLIEYPICCVVSGKDQRFAKVANIAVTGLAKERWLLLNRKEFAQYEEHVRKMLSPYFSPIFASDEYDGHETMLSGVYHKQGVALLLSTVASLSAHLKIHVKVLPFDPPFAQIKVGAVFRSPPLAIVQDFLVAAKRAIRSIPRSNGLTPMQGRVI